MAHNLMHGNSRDIVDANIRKLCEGGCSEKDATRIALRYANKRKDLSKVTKRVVSKPKKDFVKVK